MSIFQDEFVPHMEASNQYKKWAQANPGESAKWRSYRDACISHVGGHEAPAAPKLATSFGKALVDAGELHVSVTDIGSADYPGGGGGNNPPPSGVLRSHFTDFYTQWGYSSSDHNGQIFQNRYKTSNLQTLFSATTSWTSTVPPGAAITEVTDTVGDPGFRFVCNPEMDMSYPSVSSSKKVEIYESNGAGGNVNPYGQSMVRGLGYTDEIFFRLRFPSTGNPNGFPGPNEGVYDRRNVFWQHSMDGSNNLNYFGISRLGFTNRFFCSVMRNSSNSTEINSATINLWEVALNTDYEFRYIIKWANDNTGIFQWWVKRPGDSVEQQYLNHQGVTYGSTPNTEFGFYSEKALNNEVVISGIRVTAH
jgi:hypothetical protein